MLTAEKTTKDTDKPEEALLKKRGPGRPKGSKNKPKAEVVIDTSRKSIKSLIKEIRALAGNGKLLPRRATGELLGVSPNSVLNWENETTEVSEQNAQKIQATHAKLTAKKTGAERKSVLVGSALVSVGSHTNGRANGNGGTNRLRGILGVDTETDDAPVKKASKTSKLKVLYPLDRFTEKLPPGAQADAKKFITLLGIKPKSHLSGVYDTETKRTYWHFVGWFSVETMRLIIAKHNEQNRVVGYARGAMYGKSVVAGDWMYTSEPIIFSSDGDLLNGQNRLMACISVNQPMVFNVSFGLDPAIFPVLDSGLPRNAAQRGVAAGWSFAPVRLKTIKLLQRYENSSKDTDYLEQPLTGIYFDGPADKKIHEHYGVELDAAIDFVHGLKAWGIGGKVLPKEVGAFCLLFMARVNLDVARHFLKLVVNGGAIPGSPIVTLRWSLATLAQKQVAGAVEGRVRKAQIIRTVCAAWNSYCAGRTKGEQASFVITTSTDHKTSNYVSDLASPMQRIIDEAIAQTGPDVVASYMQTAKALHEKEVQSNHDKLTDKHGTKEKNIQRIVGTT
jgi:hypothetical protein